MELIYVQTRLKGQDSPELALEERKIERRLTIYYFFLIYLVQTFVINLRGCSWACWIPRKSALDHEYESLKALKFNCVKLFSQYVLPGVGVLTTVQMLQ